MRVSALETTVSQATPASRVTVMKSFRKKTWRTPGIPSRSRASGDVAVLESVNV